MSGMARNLKNNGILLAQPPLIALLLASSNSLINFDRIYPAKGYSHLSISNTNGNITITTWPRKEISVRIAATQGVTVEDRVAGGTIIISATWPANQSGRANFQIMAPAKTSVSLKNKMGDIKVEGLTGHISVDVFNGDVYLTDISGPSVEVKVIDGNIFFDGKLSGYGPYSLQSVRGNIDVTLPANSSFNLTARALKEKINLGEFAFNFSSQQPGAISGVYQRGGPRLTLTTYDGHILLHKR
jgi:hypothetical protein